MSRNTVQASFVLTILLISSSMKLLPQNMPSWVRTISGPETFIRFSDSAHCTYGNSRIQQREPDAVVKDIFVQIAACTVSYTDATSAAMPYSHIVIAVKTVSYKLGKFKRLVSFGCKPQTLDFPEIVLKNPLRFARPVVGNCGVGMKSPDLLTRLKSCE